MRANADPGGPGPIDCLRRGLRSLRANWQLAPLLLAQALLSLALTAAGLFLLLAGLGVSVVAWLPELGPDWPARLVEGLAAGLEAPPALLPLLAPLLAATLVWTLAFVLFCYLQAGVLGVLAEAEAGAGAGLPVWQRFRRFSAAGFDRHGRRLFWPCFWLAHLIGAVGLAWMLLPLGLAALVAWLMASAHWTSGVAVGCVGLAPLGLSLLAVSLWALLASVEVARPGGSGVWQVGRRAFVALRRRFGGVMVIWVLAVAAWLGIGAAFAPVGWGVALAAGDQLALWLGARGALLVAEMLVDSALAVVLIAAIAALLGLRPPVAAEVSP